jgi:hypothetical protein
MSGSQKKRQYGDLRVEQGSEASAHGPTEDPSPDRDGPGSKKRKRKQTVSTLASGLAIDEATRKSHLEVINQLCAQYERRIILFRGAIARVYKRKDDPFVNQTPETIDEEEFIKSTAGRSFTEVDQSLWSKFSKDAKDIRDKLQHHLDNHFDSPDDFTESSDEIQHVAEILQHFDTEEGIITFVRKAHFLRCMLYTLDARVQSGTDPKTLEKRCVEVQKEAREAFRLSAAKSLNDWASSNEFTGNKLKFISSLLEKGRNYVQLVISARLNDNHPRSRGSKPYDENNLIQSDILLLQRFSGIRPVYYDLRVTCKELCYLEDYSFYPRDMPLDLQLATDTNNEENSVFSLTFGYSRNPINTAKFKSDIDSCLKQIKERVKVYKDIVASQMGMLDDSSIPYVPTTSAGLEYAKSLAHNTTTFDDIYHETKEIRKPMTGLARTTCDILNNRLNALESMKRSESFPDICVAIKSVLTYVDDAERQGIFLTNLCSVWCYYFILSKAPVEGEDRVRTGRKVVLDACNSALDTFCSNYNDSIKEWAKLTSYNGSKSTLAHMLVQEQCDSDHLRSLRNKAPITSNRYSEEDALAWDRELYAATSRYKECDRELRKACAALLDLKNYGFTQKELFRDFRHFD